MDVLVTEKLRWGAATSYSTGMKVGAQIDGLRGCVPRHGKCAAVPAS